MLKEKNLLPQWVESYTEDLHSWKQKNDQVDDVLVMGFKAD